LDWQKPRSWFHDKTPGGCTEVAHTLRKQQATAAIARYSLLRHQSSMLMAKQLSTGTDGSHSTHVQWHPVAGTARLMMSALPSAIWRVRFAGDIISCRQLWVKLTNAHTFLYATKCTLSGYTVIVFIC